MNKRKNGQRAHGPDPAAARPNPPRAGPARQRSRARAGSKLPARARTSAREREGHVTMTTRRRRQPAGAAPARPIARLSAPNPDSTRLRLLHDECDLKGAAPVPGNHRNDTGDEHRGGGEHDHVGLPVLEARERGKGTARYRGSPTLRARAQRGRRRLESVGIDGKTRRGRRRGTRRRARFPGSPSDSLHETDEDDDAKQMKQMATRGELHSGAIDGELTARVSGRDKEDVGNSPDRRYPK